MKRKPELPSQHLATARRRSSGVWTFPARRAAMSSLAMLATVGCAGDRAVAQTTAPPSTAPNVSAAPAAAAEASPELASILDRLHDAGVQMKSLRANVVMETVEALSGRGAERRGRILLERRGEGDTRGRVAFDELVTVVGKQKRLVKDRQEYVLKGDWVIDRTYRREGDATGGNRETHRQIRPAGSKTDLLKLGAGPFPLPIGQPRDVVLKQFEVELLPPDPKRAGKAGVELKPRESNELREQFSSIVVWIGPNDPLPTVIETADRDESKLQTTTLGDVKLNEPVADGDFELEPIDPKDWQIVKEPYRGAPQP